MLPGVFPAADRVVLLRLARVAMEAAVRREPPPEPEGSPLLSVCAGAFVSLHLAGDLRGCIGQPDHRRPLGEVIVDCAAAAALRDPRFPPVRPSELAQILIELSVLTPLVPVARVDEIEIGRHGLVIRQASRQGLLLPQVASARRWTREEFLRQTCRKAGLPDGAWLQGAQIFSFEAEIFGEEPHG